MIVVEHDEEAIRAADHVVDMGPGAGEHGGADRRAGHAARTSATTPHSLTGQYLSGRRQHRDAARGAIKPDPERMLRSPARRGNNLKDVTLDICRSACSSA